MEKKKMTFVSAMRDYFGYLVIDGAQETPSQFLQELKKLTDEDKAWFRANLPTVGYEIT